MGCPTRRRRRSTGGQDRSEERPSDTSGTRIMFKIKRQNRVYQQQDHEDGLITILVTREARGCMCAKDQVGNAAVKAVWVR